MLGFLNEFSKARTSWVLLLLSSVIFLGCGFYFQYIEGLAPCHLCIIQRIAFLIILIGASFSLINPQNNILKTIAMIFWGGGTGLGIYAGTKLVYLQANPVQDMFSSCSISAEEMMNSYPILDWFPMMFEASGDCGTSSWNFYGLATMEQITLGIFACHLLAFLFVLIANISKR